MHILKKIFSLSLVFMIFVTGLSITTQAESRAIHSNISYSGFGYKSFSTNSKYAMITNGDDGEKWIAVNSNTENEHHPD